MSTVQLSQFELSVSYFTNQNAETAVSFQLLTEDKKHSRTHGTSQTQFASFGSNLSFLLGKSNPPTVEIKSVKGEVGRGHVGLKLVKTEKVSFFANFVSEVDRI